MEISVRKCSGCKQHPMVISSGTVMCPRCQISATNHKAWNRFMRPANITELVEKLERPVSVLKAVHVFTDDKGLKGLAATTLKAINETDFTEYFADPKDAEKHKNELEKALNNG